MAVFLPVSCLFWNVFLNFINVAILNVTACICLGNCHGDTCTHMGVLKKGKYLRSNNGIFKLILQENGNLEILCKTKPIWSTRTITNKVDFLYFKQNGKLVLYSKDETDLWTANIKDSFFEPLTLLLQNAGNLVLLDGFNQAQWSSGTGDICSQGL